MKDELAAAGGCVNGLLDTTKSDAAFLELSDGFDEVLEGATEAVKAPNNKHIASANEAQGFL
jgi:hypothetical protein